MIIVVEEHKHVLEQYIDDLEKLINDDDINELLLAIDDAIIANFDENQDSTEVSVMLQKIYDRVFDDN